MSAAAGAATAATFVWLGMVLAISFLDAPLKFRAPGVIVPIGLGIGRLVFRALNARCWALREGLSNAARHAKASKVEVAVEAGPELSRT